ncbi:MAG TPA: sugar transferase [Actinomycetes bacterium]|nr:sugar transferase [Actinomycetes bacterium]
MSVDGTHRRRTDVAPSPVRSRRRDVLGAYQARCLVMDAIAVLAAAGVGVAARFHSLGVHAEPGFDRVTYVEASLLLVVAWLVVLAFRGAYDTRVLGTGSEELKRVASGTAVALATIATTSYLLKASISRGFVAVTIPVGLALLLLGRRVMRRWLRSRRARGQMLHRTLVVGSSQERTGLVATFDREPQAGFTVAAVLDPPEPAAPVGEWLEDLDRLLHTERIDAVTVARSTTLHPETLRRLAWHLEGPRIDLMVAPDLLAIFGPRLVSRAAPDLPLLHLDEPRLSGPQRFLKSAVDRVAAATLLVLLLPLMLLIALAVTSTSRGPVFFVQERIGRGGRTFRFVKFRTMVEGAHLMRQDVLGQPDPDMPDRYRTDPRVTPVGRFLRRWSLDELPQLINVLSGSMSIVGPRPMLLEEAHLLDDADQRRHLTKPGLTGLWQISGRKETSWQERMQLDLDYVERWSPALDLVILARTVKVVLSGAGAF